MSTKPLPSNRTKPKRPLILAILCIAYLFMFAWDIVQVLTPAGYSAVISKIPSWFVVTQMTIFYPVSIASLIGVWQMRRWGIYLFFSTVLVSMVVMYAGFQMLPNASAFILLLVFLAASFQYFIYMR